MRSPFVRLGLQLNYTVLPVPRVFLFCWGNPDMVWYGLACYAMVDTTTGRRRRGVAGAGNSRVVRVLDQLQVPDMPPNRAPEQSDAERVPSRREILRAG